MIGPVDVGTRVRNWVRVAVGSPIFGAQHLWRQRYMRRTNASVSDLSEQPPPTDPSTPGSEVQTRHDGTGPLVMRTYTADISNSTGTAKDLLRQFATDPNRFCSHHIAGFHDPEGDLVDVLALGDECVVEIPGPWNGPVRVDELTDTSLMLITLDGHMEAGHIRFSTRDGEHGTADRFEIRSWARAGDSLFEHLHVDAELAREAQTAMWATRVTELSR